MKTRFICVVAVGMISAGGTAAAQDALAQAKTLYAAANYEEALKLLGSSDGSRTEVSQYRALCLLALGRTADAEREAAAVVEADPLFRPDEADVAPRVVSLFADVRRRLLPPIIRSKFDEAKRLFGEGNRDRARSEFGVVLRLLDDPVLIENTVLTDLKIVAEGFVDLVASTPAPPVLQPALPPAPQPGSAANAASSTRVVETPAAPIQQTIPAWQPRDPFAQRRELVGAVRVAIDETGKVTAATIERSIHPEYDRLVIIGAQRWRYQPATREGVPIPSEKIVEIRVQPK
jgi:TonB family protein